MSIQSNVNQMLGMGTLLATQHPVMRELAAKRQNVRTLETKAETIEKALKVPSNLNDKEPLGEELTEVRKQLFEADPSEKRYEEYARTKPGYIPPERRNLAQPTEEITEVSALEDPEGFLESKEEAVMEKLENQYQEHLFNTEVEKRLKQMVGPQEEMKQDQANASALTKADAKQRQRRSFLNYMKELNPETSLGYSFSEFPEHLQKAIVKQIPSKERRKMMKETDSNG